MTPSLTMTAPTGTSPAASACRASSSARCMKVRSEEVQESADGGWRRADSVRKVRRARRRHSPRHSFLWLRVEAAHGHLPRRLDRSASRVYGGQRSSLRGIPNDRPRTWPVASARVPRGLGGEHPARISAGRVAGGAGARPARVQACACSRPGRTPKPSRSVSRRSMAVVHDQQLLWSRGFGYAHLESKVAATADTMYSICSISKLFTGSP